MAPNDAAWSRYRLSKTASALVLLFLFSSTALIVTFYQKFWTFHPAILLSQLNYEHVRNPGDFSHVLHPEEHAYRVPTTITHHWNITKEYSSPDGVQKLVYLINGA